MDYVYKFPVVKGVQAGREYYIAMVPLKMIEKLFPSDNEYVAPEFRAQRRLNISRIPVISRYILENRESYVFSALAASIDGDFKFIESEQMNNTGILEVSMDAKFLINDGQHRQAAILEALKEDESLKEETISIVFYNDLGLKRSQQIFTDLNKHAVKTSNSISELYDSRDELANLTRSVVNEVKFLDKYTDKEKDNLGKYSSKLFTLNNFYNANQKIVHSAKPSEKDHQFVLNFWSLVAKYMPQWNELERNEITKVILRQDYIATQNVVLQALGRVGGYLYLHSEINLEEKLSKLDQVDWLRSAPCWKERIINESGKIITNQNAIILASNIIKQYLQINLSDDEIKKENKFLEKKSI